MFWTVIGTIVSGITVFVLGQIFIKFILEPLYEYRTNKYKIPYFFRLRGNIIFNEIDDETILNEVNNDFRILSSNFYTSYYKIPLFIRNIFGEKYIITEEQLNKVTGYLYRFANTSGRLGLYTRNSNGTMDYYSKGVDYKDDISKILNIKL